MFYLNIIMSYYGHIKKYLVILFLGIVTIACIQPVPRQPVTRMSSDLMKASVNFNKKLNALEENAIKRVIQNDSLASYKASSNGFWYKIDKKSDHSYFPKFGDKLEFQYEVFDLDYTVIYSAEEIGNQSYVVDQQEIQEGLRNGLKMMSQGDIVTFLFPSHKMFGYIGDEKKVGINQPLIYKVELNKIIKKNESD